MNTRNVKFLAVMAVLAMAFAAFAVAVPAEEQDASTAEFQDIDTTLYPVTTTGGEVKQAIYTADKITLTSITTAETSIYLLSGKTVTITGVEGGQKITISAAKLDSTSGKYQKLSIDSSLEITLKDKESVSVKATIGSTSAASAFQIYGTVAEQEEVAFIASEEFGPGKQGSLTVDPKEMFIITGYGEYAAPAATSPAGAYYYAAPQTGGATTGSMTIYGTQPGTKTLLAGDYFKPSAVGITIQVGTNTSTLKAIDSTTVFAEGIVFTNDAAALAIAEGSTLTNAELVVTAGTLVNKSGADIGGAEGSIITGVLLHGSTSAAVASGATVCSTIHTVAETEESEEQIYDVIIGNYMPVAKSTKITQDFTILADQSFTIPDKYTVTFGQTQKYASEIEKITIQVDGALDVFGKLTGVKGKNSADPVADVVPYVNVGNTGILTLRAGCQTTGFVYNGKETIENHGTVREFPTVDEFTYVKEYVDSDVTYNNVGLEDTYTIKAGKTLTVANMLYLNGKELIVEGTLVINEGAFVGGKMESGDDYVNMITLGKNGKIVINGSLAKYVPIIIDYVDMDAEKVSLVGIYGISGLDFGVGKIGKVNRLTVSGNAQLMSGANASELTMAGVLINGDLTIPKDLTMTVITSQDMGATDDTVLNGKTLTVNGVLMIMEADLVLKEGSVLDMQGYAITMPETQQTSGGNIIAEVTDLGEPREKGSTSALSKTIISTMPGAFTATDGTDKISGVTGYKISVYKHEYVDEETEKEMFEQYANIEGSIGLTVSIPSTVTPINNPSFTVSGNNIYVPFLSELKQTDANVAIEVDNVYVIVEGKVTSATTLENGYIGALYSIASSDSTTTYYAVDYNTGLSGIDGFKDKSVSLVGIEGYEVYLLTDITILDKQVVDAPGEASLIIPEGIVLTVNAGARFDADILKSIDGKLIVMKDGDCTPASSLYQVYSESEAGDMTYCGFQTALNDASAGDTITLTGSYGENADKTSLTVPAGVKVVVEGNLYILKTINVATGATLEISSGTFQFGKADNSTKNAKITVNGALDISTATSAVFNNYKVSGVVEEKNCMQIVSDGTFTYRTSQEFDGALLVGVTYADGVNTILTSISKAIESGNDITIPGKYTTDEKVNLGDSKLTILGEAKIGTIEVKGGSIDASADTASLTSSVVGAYGESGSATLVLTDFQGIIDDKASSDVYTLALTEYDAGSVSVLSGTLTVKDTEFTVGEKESFTAIIAGSLEFTEAGTEITNNGIMDVDGALVIDKDASLAIVSTEDAPLLLEGIVSVEADSSLVITNAVITGHVVVDGDLTTMGVVVLTGTIDVTETEELSASFTMDGDFVVGESVLAAAPAINGKFTLNAGHYLALFPGASVDEKQLEDLKYSDFYLNGLIYVTAYATASNSVAAIGTDGVISEVVPVIGYKMTDMTTPSKWTDSEGVAIATGNNYVGAVDEFYFTGVQLTAKIKISTTTGTSIFVDGVKYGSGTELDDITVGKHTVKVSINPGYKGTTATTFDGKTITDSFNITADMVGGTGSYVLSVTGDIQVDPGVTPEPEKSDDFGITQILLIVLVVLIAIMTVILVLRLNRA